MRIASITGIKNESDIIESFVRHNSKYIDDFYFIDDSVDKTAEILEKLAQEGFRVIKVNFDTRDYQHNKIMTAATRYINAQNQYDWIFFLDADEIIYFPNKELFLNNLNDNKLYPAGILRHYEMASNSKLFNESLNPLKECFNARSIQSQTEKIFIRGDQSDKVIIGPGNHSVGSLNGELLDRYESRIQLAHYPVRTAEQYVTRTIIIYNSLHAKLNKIPGEGNHAIRQYEWLKENNFLASPEKVTEWGCHFGLTNETRFQCSLTEKVPEYLDDIICKYGDLTKKNHTLLLALELERVADLLSQFRHRTFNAMEQMKSLI
tara:strand:- start:560 stop:1519 length:960 start_codon:yes stop_codon:yes gene_type:complete